MDRLRAEQLKLSTDVKRDKGRWSTRPKSGDGPQQLVFSKVNRENHLRSHLQPLQSVLCSQAAFVTTSLACFNLAILICLITLFALLYLSLNSSFVKLLGDIYLLVLSNIRRLSAFL